MDILIITIMPLLIYFLLRLIGAIFVVFYLQKENTLVREIGSEKKKLRILLPAYDESEIVFETLEWYKKIVNGYDGIQIYIILSRETGTITTESRFDKWISKNVIYRNKFVKLIDCKGRNKQSKLNFALGKINEDEGISSEEWLYIADFDARPPISTFNEFYHLSSKKNIHVIQQVPVMRPIGSGFMPHLLALEHLHRVIFVELLLDRLISYSFNPIKNRLWSCMGASLFIKYDVLKKVGGFPSNSDDISLGYQLALLGFKKLNLSQLSMMEPPCDIKSLLNQFCRIYSGVFSIQESIDNVYPNGYSSKKTLMHKLSTYFIDFASLVFFVYYLLISLVYLYASNYQYALFFSVLYICSEFIISIVIVIFSFLYYKKWKWSCVFSYVAVSTLLSSLKMIVCLFYYFIFGSNVIKKHFRQKEFQDK
ncbi:glycosyltransferase [Photorhabdus laumondii]